MTLLSSLEISVLDKGQPVAGATVSIDGAVTMTDTNGKAATNAIARQVDDSSDISGNGKPYLYKLVLSMISLPGTPFLLLITLSWPQP